MLSALLLLLGLLFCHADVPNRNATANRAVNCGIKAIGIPTMFAGSPLLRRDHGAASNLSPVPAVTLLSSCQLHIAKCVEPDVMAKKPMMEAGSNAVGCVMSQTTAGEKGGVVMAAPGLGACLLLTGIGIDQVIDILWNVVLPPVQNLYNKMMDKVDVCRANKLPNEQCLNQCYRLILDNITRPYVNTLCIQISKAMNSKQFSCLLNQAFPLFDGTTYPCKDAMKSSLLG